METVIVVTLVVTLGFFLAGGVIWSAMQTGRRLRDTAAAQSSEFQAHLGSVLSAQSEMAGRIQAMSELIGGRQAELSQSISERIDGMTHRLNQSMGDSAKSTHENLRALHERLAVLDQAQQNISTLAGQVTTLTNILGNKQSRGAFGQARMEALVSDGLPSGSFAFQFKLASGVMPDCIIRLPNAAPPLVVDAKFPLEAFNAVKAAETPESLKAAQQQFRNDVTRHLKDIAEKYLVPGETHDTALMFVPSESVFAEIHENYSDVLQRAHRLRIVVVSPTHLMLSIQVVQAVLRDHRFREQAHVIQDEVRKMMTDVERLNDRVGNLSRHFKTVQTDVDQILISAGKVVERGRAVDTIGEESVAVAEAAMRPQLVEATAKRLL